VRIRKINNLLVIFSTLMGLANNMILITIESIDKNGIIGWQLHIDISINLNSRILRDCAFYGNKKWKKDFLRYVYRKLGNVPYRDHAGIHINIDNNLFHNKYEMKEFKKYHERYANEISQGD